MAKKKYRHPTRWLKSHVPIQHGLTERGASSVCNALIRQKRREGYAVTMVKGALRFRHKKTKTRRSR